MVYSSQDRSNRYWSPRVHCKEDETMNRHITETVEVEQLDEFLIRIKKIQKKHIIVLLSLTNREGVIEYWEDF